MSEEILQNYLNDAAKTFRSYRMLAEKALAQVSDEQFFSSIDEESNPLATIVKHIGGNLRSRWTDFLVSDGEKPDRHRDGEFELQEDTRQSLTELWNTGWNALFSSIEVLHPDDLGKVVKIRGEDHTVVKAINRSMAHTALHVGQIVFLAKHLQAKDWKTLSIPRNRSADFNSFMDKKPDTSESFDALHTSFMKALKEEK
jgi:Protein of unknown function (DUF1572)